ncbi:MAG: D-alanine--D-serine ligase VanG [Lachnospiraceae bacterium]|nr:D-alanine--D-serine ligase VanG [Lachnospiraceae bacterium]
MEKKRAAVLFGGCSSEYEVSLQSAYGVINHIDRKRYEVVLIGLHQKTGQWFWFDGHPDLIAQDLWYEKGICTPVYVPTDKRVRGLHYLKDGALRTLSLDLVLPILHGKNGEDGTVQGALELAGIRTVGCDLLSSALCMDKELAHRVAAGAGVRVPKSVLIRKPYENLNVWKDGERLGYPLFVKPVRAGSSFGITMVQTEEELIPALERAFEHDSKVIMEEQIEGREVGCAVLGTEELLVGEADEIELSEGFFDYTEKYTLKTSSIHVPARVAPETAGQIKRTARTIYQALGCSGFARVDLFLTDDGRLYFNEVNTIPGFTPHSRFPNMMKAAGHSFEEVLGRIMEEEA